VKRLGHLAEETECCKEGAKGVRSNSAQSTTAPTAGPGFALGPDRFQPSPQPFLPVGIKKTRGMVNKSPSPKERKTVLKPLTGVELRWRITVINEIPNAPPMDLNIPRSPVMVATLSGINSMHALFEAGNMNPIPIPESMTMEMMVSTIPNGIPMTLKS